jgi:chromosome segregation ATPase
MVAATHLPIELITLLNEIKDNINEVKVDMAALKAQNHSDSIERLRKDVAEERAARHKLELDFTHLKTKIAPLWGVGIFLTTALATFALNNWLFK